ncbi:MAG: pyrimidine reductase family protein [Mycobacteriaceae bacterium]
MQQLLPTSEGLPTAELSDEQLRRLYAYPQPLQQPWLRVNFVSSIDGAVSVDDRSAGLATPADHQVFALLRGLADVVLVGAGTARAEGYGGARSTAQLRTARGARGQRAVPPIAVVTASARLDPASPLFTATEVAPLVFTTESAETGRRQRLRAAGAEVHLVGETTVDLQAVLAVLAERDLLRVLCEGGPTLFGELIDANLVDDLCLTTAPWMVSGAAGRISAGPSTAPRPMTLEHLLHDPDGTVLARWIRPGSPRAHPAPGKLAR